MYIRRVKHKDTKNNKLYQTVKLVQSYRTQRGPRQRTILNLGTDFNLPEEQWSTLANRIEEIITAQEPIFPCSEKIESLAQQYAEKIIRNQSEPIYPKKSGEKLPDYHEIDAESVENELSRSAGIEHIVCETIQNLELDSKLETLGLSEIEVNTAIGVIAGRLNGERSERAIHDWLKNRSSTDELLDTDFSNLSQNRVYQASDNLLKYKNEIEKHLRNKETNLFESDEKIVLYDLTNTFFEGTGKYNKKAHFGVSKEKRKDCRLVTLGLVLNSNGFPEKSEVFAGNISEPGTLKTIIENMHAGLFKPVIVLDAGIAAQENIDWLKTNNYQYVAVSRKKHKEIPNDLNMKIVRHDDKRTIKAGSIQKDCEIQVYCHSTAKSFKESSIKSRFEAYFEKDIERVRNGLVKKRGMKQYVKVLEKIGRIKEKYKRISYRYNIEVKKDSESNKVTDILCEKKESEDINGFYVLRSNMINSTAEKIFNIFNMLLEIEDAFRCMKSELGLRPGNHQKEERVDGHLFLTVLAYHVMHSIRFQLRKQGISYCWDTIRKGMSTQTRITTLMKRRDGKILRIRKSSRPEPFHIKIYKALNISNRAGKAVKVII